ncbi:MAG: molybdenum ABC transporter ATP-binding protein [Rhizobiaceae bacterium]|nr:molybdenum ABC transporter ATP-binding protein [Rhizobiaceae bacterium]
MSLSVAVSHRLGSFSIDAAFESSGRLTALFGPSGSGKTSLVNMIGGLIRPERGRIAADGTTFVDTQARLWLPAHRRRIGYVFQDARLFPHLTVRQNLGYGRFFTPRRERYADFDGVVDMLGIGHLLDRRPSTLSGGEKQRVAIGRALIASPKIMLMDEPLAALDEARKSEILPYIERLRDETRIPIVYVSHSAAEVARLATDVVALSAGRVVAAGPAGQVIGSITGAAIDPTDVGALIAFEVLGHDPTYDLSLLRSASGEWRVPRIDAEPGARFRALVRARDVTLATEAPRGLSALNVLAVTITGIGAAEGAQALVETESGADRIVARVTRQSIDGLGLKPGVRVYAIVKAISFDRGGVPSAAPRS